MTAYPAQLKVHLSQGERLRLGVARNSFRYEALLFPLPQPKQPLLWPVSHGTRMASHCIHYGTLPGRLASHRT